MTQLYDIYSAAFPDFRLTIDDAVAEGDRVAIRQTFEGTQVRWVESLHQAMASR